MRDTDVATERYGWSPADWSKATGLGRSKTYQLLQSEKIESVKFGRRRIITTHPREFLQSLRDGGK